MSSLVRTIGTPALAAAPSSSRTAIHARPSRESRSRMLTNSRARPVRCRLAVRHVADARRRR
jgi:hypothetical protein